MIELIKQEIKYQIETKYQVDQVNVEEPKKSTADLAIPLFGLSKTWKMSPQMVFDKIQADVFC